MKKILYFIIILVFSISLAGCSKDPFETAENYNRFIRTYMFSAADTNITSRIDAERSADDNITRDIMGSNREVCLINDWARIGAISEGTTSYNDFYIYHYESGELEQILTDGEVPDDTVYRGTISRNNEVILMDLESNIIYLYDFNTRELISKDGTTLDLPEGVVFEGPQLIFGDENYFYTTLLRHEDILLVFDYDLNLVAVEVAEDMWKIYPHLDNSCMLADGRDAFYQYLPENGLTPIDYAFKLSWEELPDNVLVYPGDNDYDFYYVSEIIKDDNGNVIVPSHLIGVKDGVGYKVLDFETVGLVGEYVHWVVSDGNGNYVVEYFNIADLAEEYYYFQASDEAVSYSAGEGKETIQIAGYMIPPNLNQTVLAFNNTSEEYYIELLEYCDKYEDPKDAWNALYLDVAVNKEADAILLYGMDKSDLIENDVLLDLNEYFEGGHVVTADDFELFIWENIQDENGKIYSVYPEFSVVGFMTEENVGLAGLSDYSSLTADGKVLFADGDAEGNFMQLMRYSGDRFIDEENGELHLDEEFVTLLEVIKEENSTNATPADSSLAVMEGRAISIQGDIVMPYSYFFYEYLFDNAFVCDSYGAEGPVLVPSMMEFGITSYSDQKEGMYAFMDYIFDEDIYSRWFGETELPVLKGAWEDWMIRLTATENYTDRFGNQILVGSNSYGMNGVVMEISSVSEEEAARMKDMIASSAYVEPKDEEYMTILSEEVQYYLNGERNIDETCEMLENRLSIALEE